MDASLSTGTIQRAILEWRSRAAAEHRSAAEAARLLHAMVALGVDRRHVDALSVTVSDELDHAALALDVSLALGGPDVPVDVDLRSFEAPERRGLLGDSLLLCLRELCIGETLAVPLFRAMFEGTTHPVARLALLRIIRDEPRHQRWAWAHLDALLAIDPDGGRSLLCEALDATLHGFADSYGEVVETAPAAAGAAARGLGLLPAEVWRRTFWGSWHRSLRPRLERRGLVAVRFAERAAARGSLPARAAREAAPTPEETPCS